MEGFNFHISLELLRTGLTHVDFLTIVSGIVALNNFASQYPQGFLKLQ